MTLVNPTPRFQMGKDCSMGRAFYLRLGMIVPIFLLIISISGINSKVMASQPFAFENPDVLIDVGHGGVDGGTNYGQLLEKTLNLEVARKVFVKMQEKGLKAAINRTGDYAPSDDNRGHGRRHLRDLSQRKAIADRLSPKVMLSLHMNWSTDTKQKGPMLLYQKNEQSKKLAMALQYSLNELYQTNQKPIYGKTFFLLKHSKCPTVIVEMGFLSNEGDRARLSSELGQNEVAEAIASAMVTYFKN